jgi:predicted dinucleotide-binding enzyme
MNIAILGAGNIGAAIGKKWIEAGHSVAFGVRDAGSPKTQAALIAAGGQARALSIDAVLEAAEVVLFSLPWAVVAEVAREHARGLDGKTLIDASNNFAGPVINNLEALRKAAPRAHLFRAFNSLGWEHFADPRMTGAQADHFYCGPDIPAREQVEMLIDQVGVRPIWVGDHEHVALVDHLGALWVHLAFRRGMGRRIALKLLQA